MNYLAYEIRALKAKPPKEKPLREFFHSNSPPDICRRQYFVAEKAGLPRVEVRRALDRGELDYVHDGIMCRWVIWNARAKNWVQSRRKKFSP